jgi:hypothetical protein
MISSNFLKKLNSTKSQQKSSSFHLNNFFKYVNTPTNVSTDKYDNTQHNHDIVNLPNTLNISSNEYQQITKNIIPTIVSPSGSYFSDLNQKSEIVKNSNKVRETLSQNNKDSNIENIHINIPLNIQTNKFNDNLKNIIDSITKYSEESSIDESTDLEEENMWNKEMVKEFIDISEECSEESVKYKNQSSFYINWGNSLKILNVVLGVSSMCIASSSLDESVKNPIYIVLSGLYSISSSVYGIFSFSEKGVVLKDISYQLDNLSRMIRCEILKPPHNRQSVNDFIIFIQSARDKIIKKDNTN